MNYCPSCGSELIWKFDGGRDRPACPKDGCGFIHFGHHSIGCGGVVIRDNKALLIQRGINPNRGAWQIPGGYVESDEEIVPAVEREVLGGHWMVVHQLGQGPDWYPIPAHQLSHGGPRTYLGYPIVRFSGEH